MAFLDFRKAFDTVWERWSLYAAWNIGIRGTLWKLIDNMYANVEAKVKLGCIETEVCFLTAMNELNKVVSCHRFSSAYILASTNLLGIQFCNVQ